MEIAVPWLNATWKEQGVGLMMWILLMLIGAVALAVMIFVVWTGTKKTIEYEDQREL